ncbi:hypothetical protein GGD81_000234 [Rhodobium orientis]|uniref:Uncharacterized protein n=1 Tax=Rhodobium orientis TaxID=34017 RepID=A0A327JWS4_9HYPH|nr:hypothetical protein [Rhodobium orientis]MBB4301219.1 hypothetical protein [Rhodobium orientis]MBK5951189.1 hypothetical protein [Rhodobium orientis]RAI30015.1 hypothetical protein CH339_00320 [Rhodobium orientis]
MTMEDNVVPHERIRTLREAVQQARIAEADRSDALEQRRQTEQVRLELVARELEGVFAEAREKSDQFICEISAGATPRLWIDVTSHVAVANDIHTYRFLKDTRLGRIVLAETDDTGTLADRVTAYIAERVVDLERAVEADWQIWRLNEQAQKEAAEAQKRDEDKAAEAKARDDEAEAANTARLDGPAGRPRERGHAGFAFLFGLILGCAALAVWMQASGQYDFRQHLKFLQTSGTASFPQLTAEPSEETATATEETAPATPAEEETAAEPADETGSIPELAGAPETQPEAATGSETSSETVAPGE